MLDDLSKQDVLPQLEFEMRQTTVLWNSNFESLFRSKPTTKLGPMDVLRQLSISRRQKSIVVWSSWDSSRIPHLRSMNWKREGNNTSDPLISVFIWWTYRMVNNTLLYQCKTFVLDDLLHFQTTNRKLCFIYTSKVTTLSDLHMSCASICWRVMEGILPLTLSVMRKSQLGCSEICDRDSWNQHVCLFVCMHAGQEYKKYLQQ